MELKGRLRAIANMIDKCEILTDIGTDHAYIPINAVERGICNRAIAVDINKGPVEIAANNIKQAGFSNSIITRLADGLDGISQDEVDTIVMAGMGGLSIIDIISNNLSKAMIANILIMQPMNSVEYLREWLGLNGFEILDEELEQEEYKIYNILKVNYTGTVKEFEPGENVAGLRLIEKKHPLLYGYLDKKMKTLSKIIIEQANGVNVTEELEYNNKLYEQLLIIQKQLAD